MSANSILENNIRVLLKSFRSVDIGTNIYLQQEHAPNKQCI